MEEHATDEPNTGAAERDACNLELPTNQAKPAPFALTLLTGKANRPAAELSVAGQHRVERKKQMGGEMTGGNTRTTTKPVQQHRILGNRKVEEEETSRNGSEEYSRSFAGGVVHRGKPFDGVLALGDEHNWDTGDFADAALEVLIASGHDVALVLGDPVHQAIVGVGARVRALDPLEAGILGDAQGHPVLLAQLLQLRHHAVGDDGDALGQQAIHERGEHVQLVLNGGVDEVGVHQDPVWGPQAGVVGEEELGARFWPVRRTAQKWTMTRTDQVMRWVRTWPDRTGVVQNTDRN